MGGGVGLGLRRDVTLSGTSAVFRLPKPRSAWCLRRSRTNSSSGWAMGEARRLAVTVPARRVHPLKLRLVHAVHAAGALDRAVHGVLAEILQCAPGAIAATKSLMARARLHSPSSLVGDAAEAFATAALGAEGAEGTAAFAAKRKPSWAP